MAKSGLYTAIKDGKRVLMFNGRDVDAVFAGNVDSFGTRVDGDSLKVDGVDIATSSVDKPNLAEEDSLMFGDANLGNGICINITAENYGRLRSGSSVAGYARYNKRSIYNIVSNVSTADTISFTEDGEGNVEFDTGVVAPRVEDMIYNNVAGLQENTEDLTATMTSTACPFVKVKNIDAIVPVGTKLVLEYFVDNKTMDSINRGAIVSTFTVIVKPAWSNDPVTKTTYAGMFSLELPILDTEGETWLSIRCVDSNGVASVEQHIDLLARDEVTPNYYQMREEDLTTYGIVPDEDDIQVAYNNKIALASMFAAVKQDYNGIVMLKRTYWIDYHDVFGTQTYYKCAVANKYITSVEEMTEQGIITAGVTTEAKNTTPTIGEEYNVADGLHYFVVNTSTASSITIPDGFTLDLNGSTIATTQFTDLHKGKIFELHNYDTHIINGIIKGSYEGFDFDTTKRRTGKISAEQVSATAFGAGAKYCSLKDLDISYTLGYEFFSDIDFGSQILFDTSNICTDDTRINIANGQRVSSTGMMSSDYIELPSNPSTICFGRLGYGNFDMGTRKEVFFSFYDSNKAYISSIKAKIYSVVRIPANAKYMRFTGYGGKSLWPYNTNRGTLRFFINASIPTNIVVSRCTWHDTRTCALTISGGIGITISNCHWYNIALESGRHQVTKILGDFEDRSNYNNRITINDCLFEKCTGENYFNVIYGNNLDFCNNVGIYLHSGGIEDGIITDNKMSRFDLIRRINNPNPHVIYDNNVIDELVVTYESDSTIHLDDSVEEVIPMSNTTITKQCSYEHLWLIDSDNGGKLIER